MGKVHLELFSGLAESLGIEDNLEAGIAGDNTVRHLLGELAARYPSFGQFVFDVRTQSLTENVIIFLNDRHIELVNGLETKLNDGDTLTLVPPIEGG